MRRVPGQAIALLSCLVLIGLVFVFSGSTNNATAAGDPKPCITKKFAFKDVEAACKAGGQKAAKKLMKSIVKKAKKAGDKNASDCLNCHVDLKKFERTKKATEWLKPYAK